MRMFKKLIAVMLIALLLVSFVPNFVHAETMTSSFSGKKNTDSDTFIKNTITGVLDVVRIVGAAVAVIILLALGIKYMVASAGDRADIKKYAANYIIGAIILFAAPTLLTIIVNFITGSLTVA